MNLSKRALKRSFAGATLALSASLLAVPSANADLITDWDYVNNVGFYDWTPAGTIPTGVEGSVENPVVTAFIQDNIDPTGVSATVLQWGQNPTSGLSSSLSIGNNTGNPGEFTGSIVTNGAFELDLELSHFNEPINGADLVSTTLFSIGELTATAPPDAVGTEVSAPVELVINFQETPNFPVNGVCQDGTTPVPVDGCPDIFVVAAGSIVPEPFIIDGYLYTFELAFLGLEAVSDEGCIAAGVDPGCVGFITDENDNNTLTVLFALNAQQIPEPGSLALLGAGLAGLGFMRRRRNQKKDATA